jgi:phosphatidylserine/phosphatidylglycerophosphate/cardiolipin synthase-like enzyme
MREAACPLSVALTVSLALSLALSVGGTMTACTPSAGPDGGAAGARFPAARVLVEPDDGAAALVDAIRMARREVLVEVYMLTAQDILTALLDARAAGRSVRVLLEPVPYGAATANLAAFATLAAAGIDVRWVSVPGGLVHAKLMVVDGAVAYVLTLNLTAAGTGINREFAVIDSDPTDVGWATAIWNADAVAGDPGPAPRGAHLLASPIDARPRLAAAIDGARSSIRIEMEELSDDDLASRLGGACGRGVGVTVVAPATNRSAATTAALATMAAAGVTVRVLASPTIHAKTMIVDGVHVYVGSINFTRASLDDNREIGVLFDDAQASARITATAIADATSGVPP